MSVVFSSRLRSRARARMFDADGWLSAFAVGGLGGLIALALVHYHYYHEGWPAMIAFAGSITLAQVAVLLLVTRRPLFSVAVVGVIVALIVVAAETKRHYIDMVLHAYDVVFYFTSPSTLSFLWVDHKLELLGAIVAVVVAIACGSALHAYDRPRIARTWSGAVLALCVVLALWASGAKGERRHTLFTWDSLYLSSFYASWAETLETLWRGQLLEALATQGKPPFKVPVGCAAVDSRQVAALAPPATRPAPHIILIHQESVVPPSVFPTLDYDRSLNPFFASFDGRQHPLRVETYGGASWLTEFSVVAGVSTYAFGGMRTFVQALMAGRIRETLPQTLERCGYRNALFYPVPKDFVSSGRFYSAIGLSDIYDFKRQGAKRYNERDSFYYGNAMDRIERDLASAAGPLFTYVITAATHQPYRTPYEPDVKVAGGGSGTEPEMSEYLRRLAMAKMDYAAFKADLLRRFPNERFLVVQYGDHQPVATRSYLGFSHVNDAEDILLKPDSVGFMTYYAIEGINYDPPPMPSVATLDVPYLGAVMLQSARLPLSEAMTERLRLLTLCEGRYQGCARRDEILGFHRRLMDSGIVDAR